jgi:hypothetical protein
MVGEAQTTKKNPKNFQPLSERLMPFTTISAPVITFQSVIIILLFPYEILMGIPVTYVRPSIRQSVHPSVRPPMLPYGFPHDDFMGHRPFELMARHHTPEIPFTQDIMVPVTILLHVL